VAALQRDLGLKAPPRRIEAVDISTLQGRDPVASLVCFVDGRPRKSDYRHFRIAGIEGQDDFAMMQQVVSRRFRRLKDEGQSFPDLLLVDGGKGQLSSAVEVLGRLGAGNQAVIGLAKRLEEVFVPGNPDPQNIPKTSSSLRLLRAIRDESHRFAVTYHRKVRKKRTLASELDGIKGVGPARRQALLRHFGSVKRIREADVDAVAAVEGVGSRLAEQIHEALRGG
jgi:excinuclease ABC subunit C